MSGAKRPNYAKASEDLYKLRPCANTLSRMFILKLCTSCHSNRSKMKRSRATSPAHSCRPISPSPVIVLPSCGGLVSEKWHCADPCPASGLQLNGLLDGRFFVCAPSSTVQYFTLTGLCASGKAPALLAWQFRAGLAPATRGCVPTSILEERELAAHGLLIHIHLVTSADLCMSRQRPASCSGAPRWAGSNGVQGSIVAARDLCRPISLLEAVCVVLLEPSGAAVVNKLML
jgi:hypothetical protein